MTIFNGYKLVEEQEKILDMAVDLQSGDHLSIEAGAGCSKTFTLKAAASLALRRKKILYIAYNTEMVRVVKDSFPDNVECYTWHGLAYKYVGHHFEEARLKTKLTGKLVASYIGLNRVVCGLAPSVFCSYVIKIINNYCLSADCEMGMQHTDSELVRRIFKVAEQEQLRAYGLQCAKGLWLKLIDSQCQLPISHDIYLKLFALKMQRDKHQLPYDVVMLDEAQDTAPVCQMMYELQMSARRMCVGDRDQSLYGFRGACNSMEQMTFTHSGQLTKSFRFGNELAGLANTLLRTMKNRDVNYRGNENIKTDILTGGGNISGQYTLLSRTNQRVMSNLLDACEQGRSATIIGGIKPLLELCASAEALKNGYRATSLELAAFDSWQELKDFSNTELGRDLASFVRSVEKYGASSLYSRLQRVADIKFDDADCVFGNVHKAKGSEYPTVILDNDFMDPKGMNKERNATESNLIYVAATRAIHKLDISSCDVIKNILNAKQAA